MSRYKSHGTNNVGVGGTPNKRSFNDRPNPVSFFISSIFKNTSPFSIHWPVEIWTRGRRMVFSKEFTVNKCPSKNADCWIRTRVLCRQNKPDYQLSHNHCPSYLQDIERTPHYSFSCIHQRFCCDLTNKIWAKVGTEPMTQWRQRNLPFRVNVTFGWHFSKQEEEVGESLAWVLQIYDNFISETMNIFEGNILCGASLMQCLYLD